MHAARESLMPLRVAHVGQRVWVYVWTLLE